MLRVMLRLRVRMFDKYGLRSTSHGLHDVKERVDHRVRVRVGVRVRVRAKVKTRVRVRVIVMVRVRVTAWVG
jgi:hypothetical protein